MLYVMMNEERLELLQEMINIGFGRASSAIADLLNVFVTMSVPKIHSINRNEICDYLIKQIGSGEQKVSMIKQVFRSDFMGETVLVFPEQSGTILTNLLINIDEHTSDKNEYMLDEVLIEVGNIIIGACMGKIAELLNTVLTYNIPQIVLKNTPISRLNVQSLVHDSHILVIENSLRVEDKHLDAYLFIIINEGSLSWLYNTLDESLEALCSE